MVENWAVWKVALMDNYLDELKVVRSVVDLGNTKVVT